MSNSRFCARDLPSILRVAGCQASVCAMILGGGQIFAYVDLAGRFFLTPYGEDSAVSCWLLLSRSFLHPSSVASSLPSLHFLPSSLLPSLSPIHFPSASTPRVPELDTRSLLIQYISFCLELSASPPRASELETLGFMIDRISHGDAPRVLGLLDFTCGCITSVTITRTHPSSHSSLCHLSSATPLSGIWR